MKSDSKTLGDGAVTVLVCKLFLVGCATKPNDDAQLTEMNVGRPHGQPLHRNPSGLRQWDTKNFTAGDVQHY